MQTNGFIGKFQEKLEKILLPISEKLGEQRHLAAVRDAMGILIPLTIIGGFAILLAQPPVDPTTMTGSNFFYQFLLTWYDWASANSNILFIPYNLTLGAISLYVVGAVAYRLAERYGIPKLESCFTALLTFLCIAAAPQTLETGSFMPTANIGAGGMFTAILVAIIVVEITNFCVKHNVTIKMPASVPPNVASPFKVLIPMAMNVIGFILLNVVCTQMTGGGLCDLLSHVLQPLLSASESLPSILLLLLLSQMFWFFGIHGANVVGAVWKPLLATMALANMEAFQAGLPLPYIVSDTFWGVYSAVFNFSIPLLLVLVCKSIRAKSIGKLSIVPAMFCIHEPFIFGLPVVLNTLLFIPFIFVYLLQFIVVYLLAVVQIAPIPVVPVPWTTPLILSGFLSTNFNIMGAVIQILLIVVGCIGYYPFIKAMDKQFLQEEKKELQEGNA